MALPNMPSVQWNFTRYQCQPQAHNEHNAQEHFQLQTSLFCKPVHLYLFIRVFGEHGQSLIADTDWIVVGVVTDWVFAETLSCTYSGFIHHW